MKTVRRLLSLLAVIILLVTGAVILNSCGILDSDIKNSIDTAVTYPSQYSIAYEIENSEGEIRKIKKTVDGEGNVYFMSDDREILFIKDESAYHLYEKNSDGEFVKTTASGTCNSTYIDNATAKFTEYAEQSKKQFIPGMKSTGEEKVLERECYVYGVKLGGDNTGISFSFYVDKETGICLGFESSKSAAGFDLGTDGEVFRCTEFITENITQLVSLVNGTETNNQ